jgi:tRNA(Ile)-lysidine synthase
MRGTGLRGLRGILSQREDGVVRPLLGIRRRELHAWLSREKIPFRHDSSNDDCIYDRNRIRHKLLPRLRERGSPEKLALIARETQEFWRIFGPGVDGWIAKNVGKSADSFAVRKEGLADYLHASEGLRSVFEEYGIPVDAFHLDEVSAQAMRKSGMILLPGGWRYHFRRGEITFCKGARGEAPEFACSLNAPGVTECRGRGVRFVVEEAEAGAEKVPRDNLTVLLDRSVCGGALSFRSWKAGDRFQPLGSRSSTTVREFLTKQKIAAIDRPGTGVVEGKDGRIVWIPGIRIAHDSRVRRASRKLWKISYQSCPSIA